MWSAVFLERLALLQCSWIKQHPVLVRSISGKTLIMAARWPIAVTHKGFPKGFLVHIIRDLSIPLILSEIVIVISPLFDLKTAFVLFLE